MIVLTRWLCKNSWFVHAPTYLSIYHCMHFVRRPYHMYISVTSGSYLNRNSITKVVTQPSIYLFFSLCSGTLGSRNGSWRIELLHKGFCWLGSVPGCRETVSLMLAAHTLIFEANNQNWLSKHSWNWTTFVGNQYPERRARWAHVGPTWSRQDARWANVGPTKFAVGGHTYMVL